MPGSCAAALYRAMKEGRDDEVSRLLAADPELPCAGADGAVPPPLIGAVLSGRLRYVDALLRAGSEADGRNLCTRGSTYNLRAREAALWFRREDMERALVRGGSREDFGTLVFRRDAESVATAIRADPGHLGAAYIRPDFTLLHVAAELGSASLAALFLEHGLDPGTADGSGQPPLYYAARNEPALDVLEALVEAGADVNHRSRTGITALTAACRHRRSLPTVRWLLEHGADPNLVPKNRVSALMKAAGSRVPEMVRLLLDHGADPTYRGKRGESALDVARRRRATEIVEMLEQAG